jgi:hypothetical protein
MERFILIYTFNHGCCGGRYKNFVEAVLDGGYSVYTERTIKEGFNFRNGTMNDLKRFAKDNYCTIMKWSEFEKILETLPEKERIVHEQFIYGIQRI